MTGIADPLPDQKHLRTIDAAVKITPAFRLGIEDMDAKPYLGTMPGGRRHRLEPIRILLDECIKLHAEADPAVSDRWLAPRLHAALRLSRREAGARGAWRFLGLWAADYVRWRFGKESDDVSDAAKPERFLGNDSKQALARLWWMAELFRNGKDYSGVVLAFTQQDIVNNLFRMTVAYHRPTALATLAVLPRLENGYALEHGRVANALAKAINAAASTQLLDVMAVDPGLDLPSRSRWEAERDKYDPRTDFSKLPEGPDDGEVPEEAVATMKQHLTEWLKEAPVRGQKPAEPELQAS